MPLFGKSKQSPTLPPQLQQQLAGSALTTAQAKPSIIDRLRGRNPAAAQQDQLYQAQLNNQRAMIRNAQQATLTRQPQQPQYQHTHTHGQHHHHHHSPTGGIVHPSQAYPEPAPAFAPAPVHHHHEVPAHAHADFAATPVHHDVHRVEAPIVHHHHEAPAPAPVTIVHHHVSAPAVEHITAAPPPPHMLEVHDPAPAGAVVVHDLHEVDAKVCVACRRPIQGFYADYYGQLYHSTCLERTRERRLAEATPPQGGGTRSCSWCHKSINGFHVEFCGHTYHSDCFESSKPADGNWPVDTIPHDLVAEVHTAPASVPHHHHAIDTAGHPVTVHHASPSHHHHAVDAAGHPVTVHHDGIDHMQHVPATYHGHYH